MPCLEETDLSPLAQQHIKAQQANIKNQRSRLTEIQDELQKLKSDPDSDPLKITEAEGAIADLEYHLNGKVSRDKLNLEADQLKQSGLKKDRLARLEKALKSDGD
jgi:septal ring factor EnvC (AmiA/AmiB activator)